MTTNNEHDNVVGSNHCELHPIKKVINNFFDEKWKQILCIQT